MIVRTYYTVEEASRWLTCTQPVSLEVLRRLGKDCSMYCRIMNIPWVNKETPDKPWPVERAYTQEVILEVFSLNPDVKNFIP